MTDDNKITDLGEARGQRFLNDLFGKFAALSAGLKPIEDHVNWYLENGFPYGDMLHGFAYSAAAQCFRDLPKDEAEKMVRQAFEFIVSTLREDGPLYGHESYSDPPQSPNRGGL